MLKINIDKYTDETKETIEEFKNTVRTAFEKDNTDETILNTMDLFLNSVDAIIELARKEPNIMSKAYLYCGLMQATLMLQDACEQYSNNIPPIIDSLVEALKKLVEE